LDRLTFFFESSLELEGCLLGAAFGVGAVPLDPGHASLTLLGLEQRSLEGVEPFGFAQLIAQLLRLSPIRLGSAMARLSLTQAQLRLAELLTALSALGQLLELDVDRRELLTRLAMFGLACLSLLHGQGHVLVDADRELTDRLLAALAPSEGRLAEPRVDLGARQALEQLGALTAFALQEGREAALRQEHDAEELLRTQPQRLLDRLGGLDLLAGQDLTIRQQHEAHPSSTRTAVSLALHFPARTQLPPLAIHEVDLGKALQRAAAQDVLPVAPLRCLPQAVE
jgi:hypothetical protein